MRLIAISIMVVVLIYGGIAFVTNKWDPMTWGWFLRLCAVALLFITIDRLIEKEYDR